MIRAFLLIFLSAELLFADIFPHDIGNQWLFSYKYRYSNFGDFGTYSGNIILKIIDTSNQIITFEKKQESVRHYSPRNLLDTTYNPPLVSFDTMSFLNKSGILVNTNDTNMILINSLTVPGNSVTITDTQCTFNNRSLTGYKIQRTSSLSNPDCIEPNYFILADNIGPISYTLSANTCSVDFGFDIKWELTSFSTITSAKNFKKNKAVNNENPALVCGSTIRIPIGFNLFNCKVELIQLSGKRIWQEQIHGKSNVTIPNTLLNSGACLVRVTSDGNVLTERILLVQ
jgi:hypothetical protein